MEGFNAMIFWILLAGIVLVSFIVAFIAYRISRYIETKRKIERYKEKDNV